MSLQEFNHLTVTLQEIADLQSNIPGWNKLLKKRESELVQLASKIKSQKKKIKQLKSNREQEKAQNRIDNALKKLADFFNINDLENRPKSVEHWDRHVVESQRQEYTLNSNNTDIRNLLMVSGLLVMFFGLLFVETDAGCFTFYIGIGLLLATMAIPKEPQPKLEEPGKETEAETLLRNYKNAILSAEELENSKPTRLTKIRNHLAQLESEQRNVEAEIEELRKLVDETPDIIKSLFESISHLIP